ncbi:hypothetical protein VNI00_015824 [Paramarasmius palmivorus]|uniref:DUF6593 domain-containing protein n=1 Tax=Paramarasmius palmivorus TaxID=297713 RepID=A0AAW0BJE4_9AGAR
MEFIFSKDDVRNSTLTLLTNEPIYEISTSSKSLLAETTVIKKFRRDGESEYMGLIELHGTREDECRVWGRNMPPKSESFWKSAKSFVASNGQKYTWKMKSNANQELRDQSDNTIATWERSHTGIFSKRPRPAKLSISHAAVSVADDIVSTFVVVEQWTRINRSAAASSVVVA